MASQLDLLRENCRRVPLLSACSYPHGDWPTLAYLAVTSGGVSALPNEAVFFHYKPCVAPVGFDASLEC